MKPKPMFLRSGRIVPERYARIVRQLIKIPEPRKTEIITLLMDDMDRKELRFPQNGGAS